MARTETILSFLLGKSSLNEAVGGLFPGHYTDRGSGPNPVAAGQSPDGIELMPVAGFAVPAIRAFPHHSLDCRDGDDDATAVLAQVQHWLNVIDKNREVGLPGMTPADVAAAERHLKAHASRTVIDRADYAPAYPDDDLGDANRVTLPLNPMDRAKWARNTPRIRYANMGESLRESVPMLPDETVNDFERNLRSAFNDAHPPEKDKYHYINDIYNGFVIVCRDEQLFRYPYTRDADGKFEFGTPVEVRRVTTYEPVAEQVDEQKKKGGQIQTVIFSKKNWTAKKARKWLKDHDMKSGQMVEKKETYHFRQAAPGQFKRFRTQVVKGVKGVTFVFGFTGPVKESERTPKIPIEVARRDWLRAVARHNRVARFPGLDELDAEDVEDTPVTHDLPVGIDSAHEYVRDLSDRVILGCPDLFPGHDGVGLISGVVGDRVIVCATRANEAGVTIEYFSVRVGDGAERKLSEPQPLGSWVAPLEVEAVTTSANIEPLPGAKKKKKKAKLGPLVYIHPANEFAGGK